MNLCMHSLCSLVLLSPVGCLRDLFWAPSLFTVHTLPLGHILRSHGIDFHCYTDNTQLYFPLKPGSTDVSHIMSRLSEMKNWTSKNFLKVNDSKSEVTITTPPGSNSNSMNNLSHGLGALSSNACREAPNLGVIFWLTVIFWCPGEQSSAVALCSTKAVHQKSSRSSVLHTWKRSFMLLFFLDLIIAMHFILASTNLTSTDSSWPNWYCFYLFYCQVLCKFVSKDAI